MYFGLINNKFKRISVSNFHTFNGFNYCVEYYYLNSIKSKYCEYYFDGEIINQHFSSLKDFKKYVKLQVFL